MKKGNILLVDDNQNVLNALEQLLEPEFMQVLAVAEPDLIPGILELKSIDVILMDMNFKPGFSSGDEGLLWLQRILKIDPDSVVIMMTAYGEVDLAVRAIKGGANDFILKPWNNDKLITTLKSGLDLRQSRDTISRLKNKQAHLNKEISDRQYRLIGNSAPMLEIKKIISKIAATDSSILILGDNGTGKELIAREIHNQSKRKDEVFIHVDMGAISETLFESELFGHLKGAYTDAKTDRAGRFEIASGGTLFLDEIGNLSPNMQSKLLNVIQNREVYRLGSNKPIHVDIRIICATNQNLEDLIRQKKFREDLYYRINTIEITSPPLRDREKDIILLADYFLDEFKKKHQREDLHFSARYQQALMKQEWPGNVRQLRNHIEKVVILTDSSSIISDEFSGGTSADKPLSMETSLQAHQHEIILDALQRNRGNISKTAEELGVARSTIYNKIKKHGLQNQ